VARVPGFANGGMHSGGWRMVGERGPELEYTGPSQITSNSASRSLVDNSEMVAELRRLNDRIDQIAAYQKQTTINTGNTSHDIKDIARNGITLAG